VRAILPEEEIPDTVAQAIVARAEGNPFFLEELALPVAQGGPHGNLASVPQSIGDVLMARMQRLPDQLQRVLETAATLGREGPVRLLDGMLQSPADLPDQLQELVRLEFLYDQMGGTGRRFSFRHALIQEVTYSRLAQPARSRLHAAAGRALEALYADRLEEVLDRLAYHYSRTDESRTAVTYLTRFAEKATASYSLTEAVAALEDALIHAERLASDQGREACVLRIVAQLAECLIFLGRLTEARDVLLRHTDRVDRLSDPLLVGPHYFLLAGAYDHLGEPKAALAAAHRSIAEATRAGDAATVGKAHVLLAHANLWAGQFKTGVENSRRAARGLAGHGEVLWSGMAHWIRAWHHILLGEFALAVEASEEVRAVGEASGIRRLESYGICIAGWVAFLHGDVAAGIEACERAATLAPDPLAEAVVLSILGEAYAEAGEFQQGEQRLTKAVGLVRQFHMPQMECWTLCRLSHIHIAEGRIEVARELASRMLLLAGQATFPFGQGLTQRVLGRVAAATNSLDIAQMTLTRALDIFSELRARYEVARTRVDLAGLAHLSNDHSGSLSQLRKAYALYSELGARGQCERVVQLGRRLGAPLVEQ
jgi:adenylate cyclase